jgi:hypothetical protein
MPNETSYQEIAMSTNLPITKATFTKRLSDLCLKSGLPEFPKNETDQQILLKSAMLMVGQSGSFTEKEINAILQNWINNVCPIKTLDYASLRRYLVDAGYLTRSKDGSSYEVVQPGPGAKLFEADIDQLDPVEVIAAAREEIARRKREYLERSKGA